MLTLGQAARLTDTSKTTLTRAIKAGRLSAIRRDDGSYEIDPAELSRVYTVKVETPATGAATGVPVHRETPERDPGDTLALRAEIEGLRAQLALMREHADELRHQRDGWQNQAEASQRLLSDQTPRRGWFGLVKRATS
jgi:hypothetical protein